VNQTIDQNTKSINNQVSDEQHKSKRAQARKNVGVQRKPFAGSQHYSFLIFWLLFYQEKSYKK